MLARGEKRDFIYFKKILKYEESTRGVQGEYEGSTREYEGSTREYEGITREYEGSTREYEGSTREYEEVWEIRKSRFFPLEWLF